MIKATDRKLVVGLEIGTAKVAARVGEILPDGLVNIIGVGSCPFPPPPSLGPAATWEEWGASFPPFYKLFLGFPLGLGRLGIWGLVPLAQCGQGTPT